MPQILWTIYFLMAQGFDVEHNIAHQDNQISMKLEQNGRSSSAKKITTLKSVIFYHRPN